MELAKIPKIVDSVRQVFQSGKSKTYDWRREQLDGLLRMFDENREQMCDALYKDLHKHKFESALMEVDFCRNEVCHALNNLKQWMKPEKVKKGLVNLMDKCYIQSEPLGVCLIMGAWNYPIQLVFAPLIGALAAGNCVIVKPSEISEHTAGLCAELIPKYLDNECIGVVNGGIPETTELLKLRFDHIFYTGNNVVAKIVMQAAAKNLTPVTLELGGKSPVFVDKGCDLNTVSRRLLWGKCSNAGQTCIAPDYVMCSKEIQDELVEKIKVTLTEFYPDGTDKSPDFGRIVNDRHFQRVKTLLEGDGDIAIGGEMNSSEKYIAPTVKTNVKIADPVMQDEIFGPVLPIIPVKDDNEAIDIINGREKPLALYVFSKNQSVVDKFLNQTSSGGFCVNDTLMHSSIPSLPFGGVGHSGIGGYHGKFSFDIYSHKRSCMERGLSLESVNGIRYPPYTEKKLNFALMAIQKKVKTGGSFSPLIYFVVGSILAVIIKMYGIHYLSALWKQ